MRRIAHAALLAALILSSTASFAATRTRKVRATTCVGATPCWVCKNCRYCKHCAKDGGKCGVCRRSLGSHATLTPWMVFVRSRLRVRAVFALTSRMLANCRAAR